MDDAFALFDLPRRLTIDEGDLRRRYFERSRAVHPDFHAASDDDTRSEMLERSSAINHAYRTLLDRYSRARHLIEIENPSLAEEGKKQIPPDLLMEVMELQEKVFEAQQESDATRKESIHNELEAIEGGLEGKMLSIDSDYDLLAAAWDSAGDDEQKRRSILSRLNLLLNTRNYLRTLLGTIAMQIRGEEPPRH